MDYTITIPLLMFISLVTFAIGVYAVIDYRGKRRQIVDKIQNASIGSPVSGADIIPAEPQTGIRKFTTDFVNGIGKFLRKRRSDEEISRTRLKLLRAGHHGTSAMGVYFGFKVLFAILLPLLYIFFMAAAIKPISATLYVSLLVASALYGFYTPDFWLKIKASIRKEALLKGFPDALDLLVVCVEAGMGLDSALTRVGEEMQLSCKQLSEELRMMNLETRAGKQRKDALRNFALRTDLEEVNSLVTLLIQTDKFGTSIAQALRVQSDFVRTRRYQKAEELAAKLPVKLIFPLILFIFPSLLITVVGPAVINIIRAFSPVINK